MQSRKSSNAFSSVQHGLIFGLKYDEALGILFAVIIEFAIHRGRSMKYDEIFPDWNFQWNFKEIFQTIEMY